MVVISRKLRLIKKMAPEIINPNARNKLVLLCEHASNHIPKTLDRLGLDDKALAEHIAYDIGAGDVTRKIAEMMGISAVLATASRLALDCNRIPADDTRFPAHVDGWDIPGNVALTAQDKHDRHQLFYEPFHSAVARMIDQHLAAGFRPIVVSIHSFSPTYAGETRPWQMGFMWNNDTRLAQALIGLLERETDLVIGANKPWSGKDLFHTQQLHGEDRRLLHTGIEIRNDMIRTEPQVLEMAALLADLLDECIHREDL